VENLSVGCSGAAGKNGLLGEILRKIEKGKNIGPRVKHKKSLNEKVAVT
jgi:hypothetical protein